MHLKLDQFWIVLPKKVRFQKRKSDHLGAAVLKPLVQNAHNLLHGIIETPLSERFGHFDTFPGNKMMGLGLFLVLA